MLRTVVEPILTSARNFQHISIQQGTKVYLRRPGDEAAFPSVRAIEICGVSSSASKPTDD
jgi:hypothetical protein